MLQLSSADAERNELKTRINKLTTELKFGEDQMNRKNDEYESTLNDLANAHRGSEDGRLNALQVNLAWELTHKVNTCVIK